MLKQPPAKQWAGHQFCVLRHDYFNRLGQLFDFCNLNTTVLHHKDAVTAVKMACTNSSQSAKLDSALSVLGLCAERPFEYSTAKRKYHQLLTSEEAGHWMDDRIFSSAWQTVREHLALKAVRLKILEVTDLLFYPLTHDFKELTDRIQPNTFGGDQGPALKEDFEAMVLYEIHRLRDFGRELDGFRQCSLPDARKLLSRLFHESGRLDQIVGDLDHMLRMCKFMKSGRVVPRMPKAATVFRLWHEARKQNDTTELFVLSQQV